MFNQLLNHFEGKQVELARFLGVTKQRVHNWKCTGKIPPKYVSVLTKKTGIKAKVLNPNFDI